MIEELKAKLNQQFVSTKKGIGHPKVYLHEVKKDSVVLKRDLDAKDSFTLSLAKFLKFYR